MKVDKSCKHVLGLDNVAVKVDVAFINAIHALNESKCRYMVIGGAALLLHNLERIPRDYDIWLDPDSENVATIKKTFESLGEDFLGFAADDLVRQNFASPIIESIFTFSPHNIDFRIRADGRSFSSCYKEKSSTIWGCNIISLSDLLVMKLEAKRPVDVQDIELIQNKLITPRGNNHAETKSK
jgi:hypothetical protein